MDISPPQLVEFDFLPKTIYLPSEARSVTLTARSTDDISGFSMGEVTFHSPSRNQSVSWDVSEGDRVSGDDLDGIYQGTMVIGEDGELGTWVAEGMTLDDNAGNSTNALLAPLGFPSEFAVATQPPLPTVGFEVDDSDPYPWVEEGDGTMEMTVLISGPAGPSGVSVTCATAITGGIDLAVAGEDYTSINTTITWSAGDASPKICSVPIIDDKYYEPGFTSEFEGFIVQLEDPIAATLGGWDYVEAHIYDSGDYPTLAFTQDVVTVSESNGTATLTVHPTSVWEAQNSVEVLYSVTGGTATAGEDFETVSGSLQWNPKDLADKSIEVPILDDNLAEGIVSETFTVELNSAVNGSLGTPSTSIIEIVDDDQSMDLTPPQLIAFDFTPISVDVSTGQQDVTVTATVTDDISGVSHISVTFFSPSGIQPALSTNLNHVSGDSLNGDYEGTITVSPAQETGTWTLYEVSAWDHIGNRRGYSTTELQGLGFPVELEVINSP